MVKRREIDSPLNDAPNDYDVGYGKPPKTTQFQPGTSGNPRGRPKGRQNAATLVAKVLNEPIVIVENNRSRKVTKLEATLKQVTNQAMSGNAKAQAIVVRNLMPIAAQDGVNHPATQISEEADLAVLASLASRLTGDQS